MRRRVLCLPLAAAALLSLGGCDLIERPVAPEPTIERTVPETTGPIGEALPTIAPSDTSPTADLVEDCLAAINDERLSQLQEYHGISLDMARDMATRFCNGDI